MTQDAKDKSAEALSRLEMLLSRAFLLFIIQPLGAAVIGWQVGAATNDLTMPASFLLTCVALILWIGSVNLFCSRVLH